MEVLDILDEYGNTTGEVKPRDSCHRLGYWHRVIHVWFINSKDKILLQKRSMHVHSSAGKWTLSVVGHVQSGESVKSSVVKECKEELGIDITENELIPLFSLRHQSVKNNNTYVNNEFNDVFIIQKDIPLDSMSLFEEEVQEVKWVPLKDLIKWTKEKREDLVIYDEEFNKVFKYLKSRI